MNNDFLKKALETGGMAMNKGNLKTLAICLCGGLVLGVVEYWLALQEMTLKRN